MYRLVQSAQEWTHSPVEVKNQQGAATLFLNSVIMPDGLIIVVLKKNYVILNKNLVTVSNIDVKKLDPCV